MSCHRSQLVDKEFIVIQTADTGKVLQAGHSHLARSFNHEFSRKCISPARESQRRNLKSVTLQNGPSQSDL